MKTVILAGGMGTRIASVASDIPKPMIPVNGKPVLEYQIGNLRNSGLTDIILVIGHLGHVIEEYFGDGSAFGVRLSYFRETSPLGTAGALFRMPELTEDFLLLNGDAIFDLDFRRMIRFHRDHEALATLMTHPNGHPFDCALIETEIVMPPAWMLEKRQDGETREAADHTKYEFGEDLPADTHRVIRWMNKEDPRLYYKNRVNAGVQILSPELLELASVRLQASASVYHDAPVKVDLDRDVLKPMIGTGRIFAYDTTEYIKDMGTPERYREVQEDLLSGLVAARNRSHPQKAVFLDRDGTINRDVGFLTRHEDLELLPGAAEAIREINRKGYLAVLITNQPAIARGDLTFEELQVIHNKLETELGKEGAYLDGIYYCPHHTDAGFPGERPFYKWSCGCRKPKPGMILRAAEDLHIDLSQSLMVGDKEKDAEVGRIAGCRAGVRLTGEETLADVVKKYL